MRHKIAPAAKSPGRRDDPDAGAVPVRRAWPSARHLRRGRTAIYEGAREAAIPPKKTKSKRPFPGFNGPQHRTGTPRRTEECLLKGFCFGLFPKTGRMVLGASFGTKAQLPRYLHP